MNHKKHEIENDSECVSVYISPKLKAELDKKAASDERPLSNVLRLLIKRYVAGTFECRKQEGEDD